MSRFRSQRRADHRQRDQTCAAAIAQGEEHGDVPWRACSWRGAVATPGLLLQASTSSTPRGTARGSIAQRAIVGARVASRAASPSERRLHRHGRGGACPRGHRSPSMQWRALLCPARLLSAEHDRQATERSRRSFRFRGNGGGPIRRPNGRSQAAQPARRMGIRAASWPPVASRTRAGTSRSTGMMITRSVLVLESAAPDDPSGRAYAVSPARTKWRSSSRRFSASIA